MTDESELRAVSDKMLANLERLAELENHKRTLRVGSDEFVQAAREVEDLSRLVFRWSGLQMQLATESRVTAEGGNGRAV